MVNGLKKNFACSFSNCCRPVLLAFLFPVLSFHLAVTFDFVDVLY